MKKSIFYLINNDNSISMKKFLSLSLLLLFVFSCKTSKNNEEQSVSYKYELEVLPNNIGKPCFNNKTTFYRGNFERM